jgi:polyvinyl alcohol dehydrogenase (cytochrome)
MRAWLIVCAIALLSSGCGKGADAPVEQPAAEVADAAAAAGTAPPAVTGASGEALYASQCAQCHEGQVKRAPHRTILGLMSPQAVVGALGDGVMREQGSAMSVEQHRLVAEFLSGRSLDSAAPDLAALQCADGPFVLDAAAPPDAVGWGVTPGNEHFYRSEVAGIAAAQVPQLTLQWAFAFPDAVRVRSQPLVAGGALFVGSHDGTVYALDKDSGCIHWRFRAAAEVRTGIVMDPWSSDEQQPRPRIYFGDLIGNVYAVDASTGELVWRDRPDDHPSLTITATPVLFEGRLHVAMSSLEVTAAADPSYACCTFRGGVATYEAATGKRLWTGYTIAEEPVQVDVNARGTARIAPSGAPIWGSMALDVERRRLYAGTGENYSSPANDRSDAIIAFDIDTGATVWAWQATAGDAWNMGCEASDRTNCPPEDGPDYDFGAAPVLARSSSGKDILLAGQKSGDVHALDPETGKLLWQRKLGRGGIQGGVHFGMSVEGDTVFVPISDFFGGPRWPGEAKPGLYALDINTGELLWSQPAPDVCAGRAFCSPGISAAISGLPGAVFAGAMDGRLRVHDSRSGAVIWEFDAARPFDALAGVPAHGGSMGGGAAPVFKDGWMYLSSGYGIYDHMPGNVLLAFALE